MSNVKDMEFERDDRTQNAANWKKIAILALSACGYAMFMTGADPIRVLEVDVKEGFSFFNTDPEHSDKVMEILNNAQLDGRRINVEISKNDGGGRRDHNGRNSGGGFGGQRSSGGFRGGDRNERNSSGGFRSDRNAAPREGGFRSDRNAAPREGGFRSERNAPASREGGFARKEPGAAQRISRREGTSSDAPREKRPRRS